MPLYLTATLYEFGKESGLRSDKAAWNAGDSAQEDSLLLLPCPGAKEADGLRAAGF